LVHSPNEGDRVSRGKARNVSEVRWGMVGCGAVTAHKSAPAYRQAVEYNLVAVASRDPSKAESYARRHGMALAFESPEALIQSPKIDAVYIATPPSSH
jgi:1,5-anhydro-D-fructose reductase (1,5-anhydro-D-mannitol-forming)